MGLSLSPLLTPYGFTTTPMVEMLGMQSEGRAYHDQQLYDLGWGGIHRRHCFTRTIEPFNPQLKY